MAYAVNGTALAEQLTEIQQHTDFPLPSLLRHGDGIGTSVNENYCKLLAKSPFNAPS